MRKKHLAAFICLLLIMSLFANACAYADNGIVIGSPFSSSTVSKGYINTMTVRFRSGPGTGYSIIGTYNTGKAVEILSYSGGWAKCRIDGVEGYVLAEYVTDDSLPPAVPSATPAPTPTPVPAPTEAPAEAAQAPSSAAAPKASPTPSFEIPKPDTIESSTSESQGASPFSGSVIVIGGTKGKNPFVIPITTSKPAASPKPTASPAPTVKPTSSPAPKATPSPAPSAKPSAPAKPAAVSKSGTITGDYVRFRTGPSTSYSIISSYNKGQELTITGTNGDWTECIINGKSGFVFSQYVKESASAVSTSSADPAPSPTPAPTATPLPAQQTAAVSKAGYISGNNVRFRKGPSLDSEIIGEFYYANGVTITGTAGDWTAVSADGKSGYVYSQYVKEGTYTSEAKTEPASSGSSSSSGSASGSGSDVVNYAMNYLGTRYTWGGASPEEGFDCSGFVYYVYKHFGVTLNRVAQDQASNGKHVDAADLQPGDILCFYSSGNYIGHAGIYIGGGKFIHSANSTTGVIITELSGGYADRGFEARRIF